MCQQALRARLEPIFEPLFDDSSFGYRPGRSAKDALRKVWREIDAGAEWIVDGDLKDYFGSIDHAKLMTLVAQRVADGRVLTLLERMLTAGYLAKGRLFPTPQGTPQGGVVSPLLSNILLTPFDREMRRRGYQLTRYADDWLLTCRSRREAAAALQVARKLLAALGVQLNPQKTRIVHVRHGFAFLGYTIKRGSRPLYLAAAGSGPEPERGSVCVPHPEGDRPLQGGRSPEDAAAHPLRTPELIRQVNPVVRGWGDYYKRAHVRRLFNQLDRWIERRLWSHHHKRWRCGGWKRSHAPAPWRVGAVKLDRADSFLDPAARLHLRESWMRENCTSSLSGGRRPAGAFGCASSDPTAVKPANKVEPPAPERSAAKRKAAEPVERRAGTKGNADQQSTYRFVSATKSLKQ